MELLIFEKYKLAKKEAIKIVVRLSVMSIYVATWKLRRNYMFMPR